MIVSTVLAAAGLLGGTAAAALPAQAAHKAAAPVYLTCDTPVGCLTAAQATYLQTHPLRVTDAMQAVITHKAPPPSGPAVLPPGYPPAPTASTTAHLANSFEGNYYFCSQSNDSGCYNDWNTGGAGTLVRFYRCPACGGNGMFNEWFYGPVTRTFPLNNQAFYNDYHDNSVLQWCNAPYGQGQSPSRCLDQSRGVNSQLEIEPSNQTTVQFFVWDGNDKHVAVYASAPSFLSGTNHAVYTGAESGNYGDGAYVFMVGSGQPSWHAIGTGY